MGENNDAQIPIKDQKKLMKTEIFRIKEHLKTEFQIKIELLKNILQLKNEKKKIERDLKDLESFQNEITFENQSVIIPEKLSVLSESIENLSINTEYIQRISAEKVKNFEKILTDSLETIKNDYSLALTFSNNQKSKLNDEIKEKKLYIYNLNNEIFDLEIKNKNLRSDIEVKRNNLAKIRENYEKLNSDKKVKLYEIHSKLNIEQESGLDLNEKIQDLENDSHN